MSSLADGLGAWLLAYALHSTVLLGAAALVTARLRNHAWRETLWRTALVGGLLTVTLQAVAGYAPATIRWTPARVAADATRSPAAPARPVTADPGIANTPAAADPAPVAATTPTVTPATDTDSQPAVDWRAVLLAAWAAGALALLVRLALRQRALQRVLGDRTAVQDADLLASLAALCRAAGLRRAPRLTRSGGCPTPVALGMREVCVPPRFGELPREQREAALAHELAHVARRDPLWHLAAGVAEAVFFFQPLHRLARLRLRESAEYLADDWAVRHTGRPLELAHCLVQVAGWLSGADPVPQGVLAMAEGGSVLARRIERLAAQVRPAAPVRLAWRMAAATLLLGAVTAFAPGAARPAPASPASGPSGPASPAGAAGSAAPREDGAQEPVIVRHTDPSQPLEGRVAWAMAQARGRTAWIAWSTASVPNIGNATVHDTHGFNVPELQSRPVAAVLGAPANEAVMMVRVDATGRIDRVSSRLGRVGMNFGAARVYWLGSAPVGESLAWFEARARGEHVATIRAGLVEAMGMHESPRVVPLMAGLLAGDPAYEVRGAAAEALGRHPGDEALSRLIAAASGDPVTEVRTQATEAIGEMDLPAARQEIRRLATQAADADVRRQAVESIGDRPGPGAREELEALAFGGNGAEVQREAVETLENIPTAQALPLLVKIAWTHPSPEVRRQAAETLGNLPRQAGLAALDSILAGHPDVEVQRQAAEMLAEFPEAVARPRLERLARAHPREEVRMEAREQLESASWH
jgi:HEAT repeat protein/beta-lactamase regulating signal transducer with metallopeptidase domain